MEKNVGCGPAPFGSATKTCTPSTSAAHPGTVVDLERLLPLLVEAGLVGMECYYASHVPAFTAQCLRLSVRYGLIPTGGSDFHGRGDHGSDLGGVFVPPECIASLEAHRARD